MITPHHQEKGQIMVIMAVALVALLGFAALAIDVGMVYSDRRYDQSVADASALAGAQAAAITLENSNVTYSGGGAGESAFSCAAINSYKNAGTDICALNENAVGDPTTKAAIKACKQAIQRAASNRFTDIDSNISDGHGVDVSCTIENKVAYKEKYLDVKVMVTSQTQTALMHLFYKGPVRNTVTAVTRIKPRMTAEYGYAIVALKPVCDKPTVGTFNFNGNGTITINGGGLYTNGCYSFSGTSLNVNVTGGVPIAYAGPNPKVSGSPTVSPAPVDTNTTVPYTPINEPICGTTSQSVPNGNTYTLQPGNYGSGIAVKNGDVATMAPGLYCLNGDFNIRGKIQLDNSLLGGDQGVTIFMRTGYVNVTANGNTLLQAPRTTDPALLNGALKGVLFYVKDSNPCNTNPNQPCIQLQGNATTILRGTIFAPKGDVILAGDPGMKTGETFTLGTQVIGSTVTVSGNVKIDINYNDTDVAPIPAGLDMHK